MKNDSASSGSDVSDGEIPLLQMPAATKLTVQALKAIEKRQISLDCEFEAEHVKLLKKVSTTVTKKHAPLC